MGHFFTPGKTFLAGNGRRLEFDARTNDRTAMEFANTEYAKCLSTGDSHALWIERSGDDWVVNGGILFLRGNFSLELGLDRPKDGRLFIDRAVIAGSGSVTVAGTHGDVVLWVYESVEGDGRFTRGLVIPCGDASVVLEPRFGELFIKDLAKVNNGGRWKAGLTLFDKFTQESMASQLDIEKSRRRLAGTGLAIGSLTPMGRANRIPAWSVVSHGQDLPVQLDDDDRLMMGNIDQKLSFLGGSPMDLRSRMPLVDEIWELFTRTANMLSPRMRPLTRFLEIFQERGNP